MEIDYYHPTTDIVTTVTMALASCLAFTATQHLDQHRAAVPPCYTVNSPACINTTEEFYTDAEPLLDEAAQFATLEEFADKLLGEVVEAPQTTVDLLNRRFWELV